MPASRAASQTRNKKAHPFLLPFKEPLCYYFYPEPDMPLTWDEIYKNATAFSARWKNARNENQQAKIFTAEFLRVFTPDAPAGLDERGGFEFHVPLATGKSGYVDFLWKNKIAIEMKSVGKNFDDAFSQLENYLRHLPEADVPDLWMVCDFETIRVTRRSTKTVHTFRTRDLRKHVKLFAELAGLDAAPGDAAEQTDANVAAALKMARLHDALRDRGYSDHPLEVYLVRLLFCLFADSTGIFHKGIFKRQIEASWENGTGLAERVAKLFDVLNLAPADREKRTLLADDLRQFAYVNGSLFSERLEIPEFDAKMRRILLDCARFDWGAISPAIFGAMFQGVMDSGRRREIGAHYTSEENILKLIRPLFLDALRAEFDSAKTSPKKLAALHEKIAALKFLDPACGCGNFLIITYRELRRLELDILKTLHARDRVLDITALLKVNVEQFYGIEIEDFPCQVAQVGMWLVDHQMNLLVSEEFGQYFVRLPLGRGAKIEHTNALRLDWETVVPKNGLSYILGNPPFVGYSNQTPEQKSDMRYVFNAVKNAGKLDYVCAWYKKAADFMDGANIRAAFVSTNSITQGEQPAILWKPLMERGVCINFGIPTFKWSNEAAGKAAVHCVIIGFSFEKTTPNINPYLLEAPNVFIESRGKPLCAAPPMVYGNKPADGGNLFIEAGDRKEFLRLEPGAKKYVRKIFGAEEYINNIPRYCLWLVDASPAEFRQMPLVMERIDKVRQFRLASKKEATRESAESSSLFQEIRQPGTNYAVVPRVSSENRKYIPMGFMPPDVIASDAVHIIPNATPYHFGILTSSIHMAWTRAVCGRLEMRYRYSKDIVYNNFPWPDADEVQREKIAALAQDVLDARAKFPDCSLSDLYDPAAMPKPLRDAHKALDLAVMKAYGFSAKMTEPQIVAALMERHQDIAQNNGRKAC